MAAQTFDGFIPDETSGMKFQIPRLTPHEAEAQEEPQQQESNQGAEESHNDQLNPWEPPDTNEPEPQQVQQAPPPPAPQAPPSQQELLDQLKLTAGFDAAAIARDLGMTPEAIGKLQDGITAAVQKTFMQSMQFTKRAIEAESRKWKSDVMTATQTEMRADTALTLLEDRLPIMKDPAMAPVGRAVLAGFMNKDSSIDRAVDQTMKYFRKLHGDMGKHFNRRSVNGRPGGVPGGFGGPDFQVPLNGADNDMGEVDWHAFLGGQPDVR